MWNKVLTIISVIILSGIALTGIVRANQQSATFQVKKVDTARKLSHIHTINVEEMKESNPLQKDLSRPKEIVTVSPEASYTIKKGDTLWAIARAYNINVSQLMERNSLTSDLIHPGLILVIPTSSSTSNNAVTEIQSKPVEQGNSSAKVVAAPAQKERVPKVAAAPTVPGSGRVITVTATAYTAHCAGCSGITATGINVIANPNAKVVSVDPSVIPLGSKVYIEGLGEYIAGDTGGAIKGNRIDVLMASERAALNFGRKPLKLTILQ